MQALAQSIKQRFETDFRSPFPLSDLLTLRASDPFNWDRLHGELDMYFSAVAGYASCADRLMKRPKDELLDARRRLSQEFFEKHSALAHYRAYINPTQTPALLQELETADRLRTDLLLVIEEHLRGA